MNTASRKTPLVVLIILDGFGLAKPHLANAVTLAKPTFLNYLKDHYPYAELCAAGKCVGLPAHQSGNSEAGHMNLGAGRVVEQDTVLISRAISQGTFSKNPAFEETYQYIQKNKSNLHLMGLLSGDQSAHSDPDHLLALLSWARLKKVKKIYLHLFTDGRDFYKYGALKLLNALLRTLNKGELVATIIGRFYAMDRKKAWRRTEITYNALVLGKGLVATSPQAAITQAYNQGISDEFIPPYVIFYKNKLLPRLANNDAVIFFNLRSDRARQLTKALVQKDFNRLNPGSFRRPKFLKNLLFVAMTDFGPDLGKILTAYPSRDIKNTLPMVLPTGRQLYIAETEKYAHITYFFNGGYANPVNNEARLHLPSPNLPSYDSKPQMSAGLITQKVLSAVSSGKYDFICVNFANPDMIAHTGNLEATALAIRTLDGYLRKISQLVLRKKGTLIITADHGNAEELIKLKTNEIDTEHSVNLVPFYFVNSKAKGKKAKYSKGLLADVAPTILQALGLKKPRAMTGRVLFNL